MSRRSNFIEGNDNFREQNLRFVRNEFEDNINQFFGGANPGGGSSQQQQKPPPRDSLIVQPTPGPLSDFLEPGRNLELDKRRQFIRKLGASRMAAHSLAVRSFKVKNFDLRYFQRQRFKLSVELGDSRQNVVDDEVLQTIEEAVENKKSDPEMRPRTPSPPRNIDWHNVSRDNSPVRNDDRSRPRNRQGAGDFRGTRDNSRGFVEHQGPDREREPFNRNVQPNNDTKNRYNRSPVSNNRRGNREDPNRNNRYANTQEFNRYIQNSDEINRNKRNTNPQSEFHRNANQQMEFKQNIRAENAEINRHNRNVNPQNTQESYRNNRNMSNDEFNRNVNWQEINHNNRQASPQDFNRNPQEFNRNPQDFNRNMNSQGNRDLQRNPREEVRGSQLNRREIPPNFNMNLGTSPEENPREMPPHFSNLRFSSNNNNRGPHHSSRINAEEDFLESRNASHSNFRQMQPNLAEHTGSPQIGRNYQRIVHNNQITICRQDWIEANRMEIDNRNLDDNFNSRQYQGYNDESIEDDNDDELFHQELQQEDFRRLGLRGPEDEGFQDSFNFEINEGNLVVQRSNDPNYLGRGRNERNERRHFNDNYENDRAQLNDSVTFRGSNLSPKRYRHGQGPGDHHPQPANQGRYAPNPRQTTTSQDRTTARNNTSSGRNPRPTLKPSQERNSGKYPSTGGSKTNQDPNPRSTSLSNPNRNTSVGKKPKQDHIAARSAKPGDQESKQTKPNRSANEVKNVKQGAAKASTSNQARNSASLAKAHAGEKRKAETNDSKDNKRKKMPASQPSFIIGGIRLPYINNHKKQLPQSEDKSYAVTFFEQTPIYNTNIYAIDDGQQDEGHEDEEESDTESLDSNQSASKGNKPKVKQIIRNKLRREWMAIYRENNYKDWYKWWKDYKWCGTEINKELDKLGDRKLRHRFCTKYPTTEIMVRETFRRGRNGLEKNTFNHCRNMRSIYLVMNETFLEALSEEQQEKLQDLIRYIPNHLWLYKIRSMVYLWERYHRILKNLDESKIHKENELKAIAHEWKDPLFHWLAKQAFDELKAISGVAWPEHRELYHGLI
ncbi:hypothetical protein KR032_004850 [Drosophila birchii]|nr:hypothetical protein KR032_004850 [Drosophila birchii]